MADKHGAESKIEDTRPLTKFSSQNKRQKFMKAESCFKLAVFQFRLEEWFFFMGSVPIFRSHYHEWPRLI